MSIPTITPQAPQAASNIFSFLPSTKSCVSAIAVFWQLPTGIALSSLGHKIEPYIPTDHKRTHQIAFRASQIAFIALTGLSGAAGILLGEVFIGQPFKTRAPDTADKLTRLTIVAALILDTFGKQTIFTALGLISPLPLAIRIAAGGLAALAVHWIRQDDADIARHMLGLALTTFAGGLPALGGYIFTYFIIGPELSSIEWKPEPIPETLPNFDYRGAKAKTGDRGESTMGNLASWLETIQTYNQPDKTCLYSTATVKNAVLQALNHFVKVINNNLKEGQPKLHALNRESKFQDYKKIYRKFALILHPDKFPGTTPEAIAARDAAAELFKDVKSAYDAAEKLNDNSQL